MSLAELVPLLRRIRDGVATAGDCARARELVALDDRLPPDLRQGVLVDDLEGDAVGLLAVLGEEETFGAELAAAIEAEAGRIEVPLDDAWTPVRAALREGLAEEAAGVDVVPAVLAASGLVDDALPVAEAVRAEAGTIDIVEQVALFAEGAWISALLDHELDDATHRLASRTLMETGAGAEMTDLADLGHALRDAAHEEAGEVDLWGDIAHAIGVEHPETVEGWDGELFAEAVRAEAGTVDVVADVMRRVRRTAAAPAPSATPVPANTPMWRWMPAVVGIAAALVLAVLVGRTLPGKPHEDAVAWDMQFATADEIAITDLSYADDATVQVFQGSGDNAPLIIWVDENQEASL